MKTSFLSIKKHTFLIIFLIGYVNIEAQKPSNLQSYHIESIQRLNDVQFGANGSYKLTQSHMSSLSQVTHSYYIQTYSNIEIYGAVASIHVDKNGEVLKTNSAFLDNFDTRISGGLEPTLDVKQAIINVAQDFELNNPVNLTLIELIGNDDLEQVWTDGDISNIPIKAKLVFQARPNGSYTLAWDITIDIKEKDEYWSVRVDASNGEILDRVSWTVSCNHGHKHECKSECHQSRHLEDSTKKSATGTFMAGTYNVYAIPVESPLYGGRSVVTDPHDLTASPFGWHDTDGSAGAEHTITKGNNCDAYEDGDNPGYSPNGNAALVFDFPINTTYSTSDQSEDAILTNLFYWTNVCHDIWYQYGFDEASGNFQENNYGNGGSQGDYCRSEAQDGSGTCNANFSTPTDGSRPRMQMYVCGSRDGDIDNGVIVHEYGHGISIRLTGGANNSGCLSNSEQMGEGWSDYFGLMMTIEPGDTRDDRRPIGNWLIEQNANGGGIRTHPYSTDMSINPHTYDDIKTESIPHGVGSVWCAMLWEMTWDLIDFHGLDLDLYNGTGGNNMAMALVIEALKLQPCSPGFVDGRDAILAADMALYNGANECLIWESFARRGLGFSADQGQSTSRGDGVEAFDIPPGCQDPFIDFGIMTSTIAETEATQNPPAIGDCRAYTDFEIPVTLLIDASSAPIVAVSSSGTASTSYDYELSGGPLTFNTAGTQNLNLRVYDDGATEGDETITMDLSITNMGSTDALLGDNSSVTITIIDNDYAPGAAAPSVIISNDLESGLGTFTTANPGAGDAWSVGTEVDASSANWTVPPNGSSQVAYANDDECDCVMADVFLYSPVIDLSNVSDATFNCNLFFEGRTYLGNTETAELMASTDGGTTFVTVTPILGVSGSWRMESYDVSAYDGFSSVQFAVRYDDGGGWLYGIAIDDISIEGGIPTSPEIATTLNDEDTQYVGPFDDVYFYSSSGELINRILNDSHDFGCVDVTIDRAGIMTTQLWDNDPTHFLTDKTLLITPTDNNLNATYELTVYYTDQEVSGWETPTSKSWLRDAKVIKHPTTIADITPSNPEPNGPGTVEQLMGLSGPNSFNGNSKYLIAQFDSGFSGVGVGDPGDVPTDCIQDITPPITITMNITAELDMNGEVMISPNDVDNGTSDNCGIESMSLDVSEFDCTHLGTNTVILTVTDNSNNSSSSSATVTVVDTNPPLVMTQDITVNLDTDGTATISPSDINNGSTENCSITDITIDKTNFNCSDLGDQIVTVEATDIAGNVGTGTATVTIEDPSFNCCVTVLDLNDDPIMDGTYKASDLINSSGVIPGGGNVNFQAGTEINLHPGFEIILGAEFYAFIMNCSN